MTHSASSVKSNPDLAPLLEQWSQRRRAAAVVADDGVLEYGDVLDILRQAPRGGQSGYGDGAKGLVVSNSVTSVCGLLSAVASGKPTLVLDHSSPQPEQERLQNTVRSVSSTLLAGPHRSSLLFATSGVTGIPRVVVRSVEGILANARAFASAAEYSQDDAILATTPLAHVYSFGVALMAGLSVGATVFLAPLPITPGRLRDVVTRERITVLQSVPFLYRWYLRAIDRRTTLRLAISAGEPLPRELQDAWSHRAGLSLSDHYGCTEAGIVTLNRHGTNAGVGRPVPGMEIVIDGPDSAGVGDVIVESSYGIGRYVEDLQATCAPSYMFEHRSGDRGHVTTDGSLILTGRRRTIVNIAGRKVDPIEVENVLSSYPGISECAVVGRPAAHTGNELVAFVVSSREIEWPHVRSFLADRISGYKIPKCVLARASLPRTASGKLERGQLVLDAVAEASGPPARDEVGAR